MSTSPLSPFYAIPRSEWQAKTIELVQRHPLAPDLLRDVVLESWSKILSTKIGDVLEFGVDYKPTPQMLGNFLHTLIPIELDKAAPNGWRIGEGNLEKDLVCTFDEVFSFEIKTSSANKIFANRSYAQPSAPGSKNKDGYYLAVNFESYKVADYPKVKGIRFGWLDHTDWRPQASPTGQQANLDTFTWNNKFIEIM